MTVEVRMKEEMQCGVNVGKGKKGQEQAVLIANMKQSRRADGRGRSESSK